MKKVLFVYDHKYPEYWKDGLNAALELLSVDLDITTLNLQTDEFKGDNYDFALGWGGFGSPVDKVLRDSPFKKGLCIAGNAIEPNRSSMNYDVLFYETEWYEPFIRFHPNIRRAFGVNTKIYNHQDLPKVFDVLSVGSFSLWKRHEKLAFEEGVRFVVGEIQLDNMEESLYIIRNLISNGVGIMDMIEPESLAVLYNMSNLVYIPADITGGGERAVWEAKACGVDVKVDRRVRRG